MTDNTGGFSASDFAYTAHLLRSDDDAVVSATLSNNINIILAALDVVPHLAAQNRIWSSHYDIVKAGEDEACERVTTLQAAVDGFLAPLYMEVGRLISEGGKTPLADVLSGYGVNVTCADVQRLYDATYPPELISNEPIDDPNVFTNVEEFVSEMISVGVCSDKGQHEGDA